MRFLILEHSEKTAGSLLDSLSGLGEIRLVCPPHSIPEKLLVFYDIAFIDLNLCKKNRDPVQAVLRTSPETRIVLTTFFSNVKEISSVFWHNCDGYLQKPVKPYEVALLLRSILPHKL